jgi:hypothetical protein
MEPEYRRRLREREEIRRKLEQERADEQQRLIHEGAYKLRNVLARMWKTSEPLALWAAAGVGLFAIFSSTSDSDLTRRKMVDQVVAMQDQANKMADQVTAMNKQLKVMQDEQRPWISIDQFSPVSAGILYGTTIDLHFRLHMKNIGRNPALAITPSVRVFAGTWESYSTLMSLQNEVCKAAGRSYPDRAAAKSLMPGEGRLDNFGAQIAIQAAQAEITKDRNEEVDKRPPNRTEFLLVGCIDYSLSSPPGDHGQTLFVYEFTRRGPGNIPFMFDIPFARPLRANQLLMTQDEFGNFAR